MSLGALRQFTVQVRQSFGGYGRQEGQGQMPKSPVIPTNEPLIATMLPHASESGAEFDDDFDWRVESDEHPLHTVHERQYAQALT